MALDDIIAQRIAATAASRRRLEESVYSLAPIREGLESAQTQAFRARSLQSQDESLRMQREKHESEMAPVPEGIARPFAEQYVPSAPDITQGTDPLPFGQGIGVVAQANQNLVNRRVQIDSIVSALGARGGANLLAKLAAYTAIENQNKKEAAARLKMAADLSAYTRVLGGGPGAVQPGDDPAVVGRGVDDYRQGEANKLAGDAAAKKDKEAEAERLWRSKYGGIAPEDLSPDAMREAPESIWERLMPQRGVGSRFNRSMEFKREQYDSALANIAADNKRADEFLNLGKQREGRLSLTTARDTANKAIRKLEDESGARISIQTPTPDGTGWQESFKTDRSVIRGPEKEVYDELVRTRDALNERLGRLGPTPESANGDTNTAPKPQGAKGRKEELEDKAASGTMTDEEAKEYRRLTEGK